VAVTFHIPGPLRVFSSGARVVKSDASPRTLGDALQILSQLCPGIRDRVLTEQGEIREHINVFVGVEASRYTGGLSTPVRDGAEISIVPAISGGRPRWSPLPN